MPGLRLVLTKPDENVLRSFFAYRDFNTSGKKYLELTKFWKSTNELKERFGESAPRMRNRLTRLEAFGLLKTTGIQKGSRWDSYWYISDAGIYYIMSKQELDKLKKFLHTNDNIRELSLIKELSHTKTGQMKINYLFNRIKNCVNDKEYSRIGQIVYEWLRETFGRQFVRFPITPVFRTQ